MSRQRVGRVLASVALALIVGTIPRPCGAAQRAPGDARTGLATSVTGPLDLNTATAEELLALPGMGRVYVRRIVENRPYSAKNQLVTRGILPQAAYERIKDRIVAHRAAAR